MLFEWMMHTRLVNEVCPPSPHKEKHQKNVFLYNLGIFLGLFFSGLFRKKIHFFINSKPDKCKRAHVMVIISNGLKNGRARKEQSLLFDLFMAFD